ncbi:MAG: PepSY domain-containing protein [Nitrospira sp.]|nr:PepSY domain-containing protein [Nitrospira sp.]
MDIRTAILAGALATTLILFGVGLLGISFGEDRQVPAIDRQEAARLVLANVPNARILEMELDTEDGRLVYEVELVTAEGKAKEVHVDATTGRIQKIEDD